MLWHSAEDLGDSPIQRPRTEVKGKEEEAVREQITNQTDQQHPWSWFLPSEVSLIT